jgi:hypothetical protein
LQGVDLRRSLYDIVVISRVPKERVVAGLAEQVVVAIATRDLVVPASSADGIVASEADNLVGARSSDDNVIALSTDDLTRNSGYDSGRQSIAGSSNLSVSNGHEQRSQPQCGAHDNVK